MSIRLGFTRVARLYCPGTLSSADRFWQFLIMLGMCWVGYGIGVAQSLPPGQTAVALYWAMGALFMIGALQKLVQWLATYPAKPIGR